MSSKSKFYFISAIGGVLLFFVLGGLASSMQESYEYIFDEDYRNMAKLLDAVKYIALVCGICDIVIGFYYLNQQDNPDSANDSKYSQPVNNRSSGSYSSVTSTANQVQNEQRLLSSGGWKCSCGRVQASYVSTCTCGKNKRDVLRAQSEKGQEEKRQTELKEQEKAKQQVKNADEMSKVSAIKEYKQLMDAGIISPEEFEAKKKQLLDL